MKRNFKNTPLLSENIIENQFVFSVLWTVDCLGARYSYGAV